jgi:LmbE family N-acetylglucosaminyl deacetylase
MRKAIISSLFFFFSFFLLAQTPASWTSADMYQALRKLNVLGSVLYVAAHPDDENTRLIAFLSKDKLYRTGYLSMTRGDGGQNLIGDEQGIELGLIRTQELLSARRIDGGEQFFSRAYDFGFSKGPAETFTKWDKEKILSDVVWVIRKFQPDVIITRFPTTGEGGHGHHTASAILANEAFTAAADPNRFPEQLKYVKPWQAKRILWNTFNFGATNTTSDSQFKFDVGGYNPLLGKSYGEIAAISRSNHKSQGFGASASRGEAMEYFKTTGGDTPSNDLMDGVDLTWKRVPGGEAIEKIVDSISAAFDFMHPEKSVKGLVRLYQAVVVLPDGNWKEKKLNEIKQLVEQCSGLFIDATTFEQFAVQTDSIRINFSLNNRLGVDATLKGLKVDAFDSSFNQSLGKNKNVNFGKTFFVPVSKPITQPYWLANKMEEGYFNVSDQQKIGQPDVDPAYIANVVLNIEGQDLNFAKSVKYKFTDPVRGELYEPVTILPAFDVSVAEDLVVYKIGSKEKVSQSVLIKANKNLNEEKLYSGDKLVSGTDKAALNKGQVMEITIPQNDLAGNDTSRLIETALYYKPAADFAKSIQKIKYDHIPYINYFKNAATKTLLLKIETYGKKIAYIVGAGDKVPAALEQMGYEVNMLSQKELSRNDLSKFDAIITGVRTYNTIEWMNNYYDKLMKYVNDGGNLIVQYNTSNNIGPVRAKIGPYNFDISRTRVTDETAEVTFLKPDHPVMNFPNKITQDDFKGWIQERSIYHATSLDKNFETIFSMHDPGESADEGSLVIAKYGKGVFVYTGLVFFRELPAGVPGAYRLMANIIALNKKKGF